MSYKIPRSQALEIHESPNRLPKTFFHSHVYAATSLSDHWGIIWGSFQTLLKSGIDPTVINKCSWKIKDKMSPKQQENMVLLDILSFPEEPHKHVSLKWTDGSPESLQLLKKVDSYCTNQYFKSIPMKAAMNKDISEEKRVKTTHVPLYYQYEFGTNTTTNRSLTLFTLHIPFMSSTDVSSYPVIIFNIGFYLPDDFVNYRHVVDTFYDSLNKICFEYQLTNLSQGIDKASKVLVDSLNQFVEAFEDFVYITTHKKVYPFHITFNTTNTFNDRVLFVTDMVTGFLETFFTVCVPRTLEDIHSIHSVLNQFSSQSMSVFHSNYLTEKTNPFFTLQFVTDFSCENVFEFPHPFCVIRSDKSRVDAITTKDVAQYFSERAAFFINKAGKVLNVDTFGVGESINRSPTLVEHTFLIYDMIKQAVEFFDKKNDVLGLFLLKEASILLTTKSSILFHRLLLVNKFGDDVIKEMKDFLDIEEDGMVLLIQRLKYEEPLVVAYFHRTVLKMMKTKDRMKQFM
ncbi:hypothetical protein EIN_267860 [Entamoeba invadens IP1]|uniref:Uncharacterized protein n=1 Tax=Entamoeba invadens IP1 TaxID=370355 RepID=A0A0A1UE23_ENTIV|nr:hypothetical protein EIN_267860 [Entamoeba invadens IP1]ELP91050.1 hypothetical protein EIN_267860 [Entamoeba invadens IP1]|eukprot:XP_004257821.1 hypothetical protein EIN_267860 [Entamoeba invadens IP1]